MTEAEEIVSDAAWLPYRFDFRNNAIEFIHLPRAAHRQIAFLDQRHIPADLQRVSVPRHIVASADKAAAPLHFIFHSGMACSTLLARALDVDGAVMGLKEPSILSDVVRYEQGGASAQDVGRALDDVLSLLARPFAAGEAVVVKSDSLSIRLADRILDSRSDSQAICLYAPLPGFLNSIAKKGVWGRIWGRKLLIGMLSARIVDVGFTKDDFFAQSDLQVAACAWLSFHRIFSRLLNRFGSTRIRTIDSTTFSSSPDEVLHAVGEHFRLSLKREQVRRVVEGPVFTLDSKTGDEFDATNRGTKLDAAAVEEIDIVAGWSVKVAEAMGFPFDLGGKLTT